MKKTILLVAFTLASFAAFTQIPETDETETINYLRILYCAGIAVFGNILHVMKKWNDIEANSKKGFSISKWLKVHRIRTVFGIMTAVAAVIITAALEDWNPGPAAFVGAFTMGWTGDSISKLGVKK